MSDFLRGEKELVDVWNEKNEKQSEATQTKKPLAVGPWGSSPRIWRWKSSLGGGWELLENSVKFFGWSFGSREEIGLRGLEKTLYAKIVIWKQKEEEDQVRDSR